MRTLPSHPKTSRRPLLCALLLLGCTLFACGPQAPEVSEFRSLEPPPSAEELRAGMEAPALEILVKSPVGAIHSSQAINLIFNQPVVPLTGLDAQKGHVDLEINPPLKGDNHWIGSSTLSFIPTEGFRAATRYTVTLPAGVQALSGKKLAEPLQWSFETNRPSFAGSTPRNGAEWIQPKDPLYLEFTHPIVLESVTEHLSITANDTPVAFQASHPDPSNKAQAKYLHQNRIDPQNVVLIQPSTPLPTNASVSVHLAAGIQGTLGELPSDEVHSFAYHTYGTFRADDFGCGSCIPGSYVEIHFSNPLPKALKGKDPLEFFELSPAVEGQYSNMSWRGDRIFINYKFKPATHYKLKLKKGLKDRFGNALEGDKKSFSFEIGHLLTQIELDINGHTLESDITELRGAVLNVDEVRVQTARLTESDLVPALVSPLYDDKVWAKIFSESGKNKWKGVQRISGPKDKWHPLVIPLNNPGSGAILYNATVTRGLDANYTRERRGLLQHTNIALTSKLSPNETLAWVTDLKTAQPLKDVTVRLRDGNNKLHWEGKSDSKGLVFAPGLKKLDLPDRTPLYLTATQGDELAFLKITDGDNAISPWNFNISYQWDWKDHIHSVKVFSDRGVYRTGDEVHFKATLRSEAANQWTIPDQKITRAWVENTRGETIWEKRDIPLSPFGTFDETFTLPKDIPLGACNIFIDIDGKQDRWSTRRHHFRVEAFRTPEFKANTTSDKKSYIAGEPISLEAEGEYLFGAPMNGADVRWSTIRRPASFNPPGDHHNLSFIDNDLEWSGGSFVEDSTKTLDRSGHSQKTLDIAAGTLKRPFRYTVDAEIIDLSRQSIASDVTFIVHPGDRYLGVGTASSLVAVGKPLPILFTALTPKGASVEGVTGNIVVSRREWNTVKERGPNGNWNYKSEKVDVEVGRCSATSAAKITSCEVNIDAPGSYIARVEGADSKGTKLASSHTFYAYGGGWAPWKHSNDTSIELIPDRQNYKPGDIAKILIMSPFKGATALITTERSGVMETRVVELKGNAETFEVKITDKHIPNLYVSAALIQKRTAPFKPKSRNDPGKPAFRLGYIMLPVETKDRRLDVTVSSNTEEVLPGGEAKVTLHVQNAQGDGVPAEVTLYAVDEGVLSLTGYQTPSLMEHFYQHRPLGVIMAESRLHLIEPVSRMLKGEQPSGGGGEAENFRTLFSTTPYWNGNILTTQDGSAEVNIKLPENLTTFRLMAVASTQDSRFGSGESQVRVSKPLLVRTALPRFARVGDIFEAGVIVNNRSGTSGAATVKFTVDPKMVKALEPLERIVQVEDGQGVEVRFKLEMISAGPTKMGLKASMGKLSDAMQITLPIHAPSIVETVATHGIVEKPVLERILPPGGVHEEVGGLDITLSSTAMVGLTSSIDYLLDYPYACAEQTSSRLMALLFARPLLETFKLAKSDPKAIDAKLKAAIARLTELQHWSGGFKMWPSTQRLQNHTSIYAMHALVQAKTHGVEVPEHLINSGKDHLRAIVGAKKPANPHQSRGAFLSDKTYALYVLALLGEIDHGTLSALHNIKHELPLIGKVYLGLAINEGGDLGQLEDIIQSLVNVAAISANGVYFGDPANAEMGLIWRSDVRATAFTMYLLLQARPEHPLLPKIASWLKNERRHGHWGNTQDNAAASMAMFTYLERLENETPNMTARIFLEDDLIFSQSFKGRSLASVSRSLSMKELIGADSSDIILSREGVGRLYYTMRLGYAPLDQNLPAREEGFTITRRYESLATGKEVTGFQAGDTVKVRLTIVAPQDRYEVAVNDPIPAGLEAINLDFATTSSRLAHELTASEKNSDKSWYTRMMFDHIQKGDTSVQLFSSHLPAGVYEYVYLTKATTYGTFAAPPAVIEEMYSPEIFGRSSAHPIEVK